MIQPPRGLYLFCTQHRGHHSRQIRRCTCLPAPSKTAQSLSPTFTLSFTSVLSPPSFLLPNSLRLSLPLGAGLPLPHTQGPSLLGSQHRSAITEGCLPFLGERQVVFLIWHVYLGSTRCIVSILLQMYNKEV